MRQTTSGVRIVTIRPVRALLGAALVSVLLTGGLLGAAPAAAAPSGGTACVPPPVAHRGDSARAPENTMPAFRKALALGVRRLELDVRFTSSGVPVLMHDATVDRTTDGTGEVAALSLQQVRSLDAGGWFSRSYLGTRVPSLFEALTLARDRGADVLVELKVRPTPEQLALVLARVRWLGMAERVTVTSFDGPTVLDVRASAPDIATALIDRPRYRDAASVLQFGTTYLVNHSSMTEQRSVAWRQAGITLRPWTVDTVRGWARMAADDAGSVITNRPADYLRWARARCR